MYMYERMIRFMKKVMVYMKKLSYKVDYTLLTSYWDPLTQQYIQYRAPYTDYVYTGSASRTVSVNVG